MNEMLKDNLESVLIFLKNGAEKVGQVASEECPKIVNEYIAYEIWSNAIGAVVLFTIACILSYFTYKLVKVLWDTVPDDPVVMVAILPLMLILGLGMGAYHQGMRAVKATVAPRVVVIEKVSELINRN